MRQFWSKSANASVTPADIGGLGNGGGFDENGRVVFESPEDVQSICEAMRRGMSRCGCGGIAKREGARVIKLVVHTSVVPVFPGFALTGSFLYKSTWLRVLLPA